jgi:hypothetical protein
LPTRSKGKEKPSTTTKVIDAFATSAARSVANTMGREIVRGVLGGLLGKPPPRKR